MQTHKTNFPDELSEQLGSAKKRRSKIHPLLELIPSCCPRRIRQKKKLKVRSVRINCAWTILQRKCSLHTSWTTTHTRCDTMMCAAEIQAFKGCCCCCCSNIERRRRLAWWWSSVLTHSRRLGREDIPCLQSLSRSEGELSGIPHTLLYMRAFSYALPWATISAFQLRTNIIALVVSLPKQGRNMCVLCVSAVYVSTGMSNTCVKWVCTYKYLIREQQYGRVSACVCLWIWHWYAAVWMLPGSWCDITNTAELEQALRNAVQGWGEHCWRD